MVLVTLNGQGLLQKTSCLKEGYMKFLLKEIAAFTSSLLGGFCKGRSSGACGGHCRPPVEQSEVSLCCGSGAARMLGAPPPQSDCDRTRCSSALPGKEDEHVNSSGPLML